MLTPQNFKGMFYSNKGMFYSNEQALNSKMWLNVGVNSKSLLYSKQQHPSMWHPVHVKNGQERQAINHYYTFL